MRRPHFATLVAGAVMAFAAHCEAQGKNLLFYGNSYSSRNGSVAEMVTRIAVQAGQPAPTIVNIGFADASGNASFGIPLPCNQALMGKSLLAQGFDWDATLSFSLPVAMSPALILTLGY